VCGDGGWSFRGSCFGGVDGAEPVGVVLVSIMWALKVSRSTIAEHRRGSVNVSAIQLEVVRPGFLGGSRVGTDRQIR